MSEPDDVLMRGAGGVITRYIREDHAAKMMADYVNRIEQDRDAIWNEAIEAAADAAAKVGRPVGAGDGDTYIPGTSADAAQAIRALKRQKGDGGRLQIGTCVSKTKGSSWRGRIVGTYSTSLTPEGYAVESEREPGSVQIYPRSALDVIHILRCGDQVRHIPSGEVWVVAWADDSTGDLAPCGWPNSIARISDVALIKAATDEEHEKYLNLVLRSGDSRASRCRTLYKSQA